MYAIPPACGCSCFAAATDKGVLLGRNSDFLTALEGNNCNVIYRLSGGGHAFTGNTTSFLQMEDGVNDCGLAAGLTSWGPTGRKPGFNAGLLLRYLLEHCESVAQAVAQVGRLPLASAMTLTLADPSGAIAVVECDHQKLETARRGPVRSLCLCHQLLPPARAWRAAAGSGRMTGQPTSAMRR